MSIWKCRQGAALEHIWDQGLKSGLWNGFFIPSLGLVSASRNRWIGHAWNFPSPRMLRIWCRHTLKHLFLVWYWGMPVPKPSSNIFPLLHAVPFLHRSPFLSGTIDFFARSITAVWICFRGVGGMYMHVYTPILYIHKCFMYPTLKHVKNGLDLLMQWRYTLISQLGALFTHLFYKDLDKSRVPKVGWQMMKGFEHGLFKWLNRILTPILHLGACMRKTHSCVPNQYNCMKASELTLYNIGMEIIVWLISVRLNLNDTFLSKGNL